MARPVTAYGIPNCDTVKKARAWWADRGIALPFHDYKKQGVPQDRLAAWLQARSWQELVNTRGTTWRALSEAERAAVTDAGSAQTLLIAHPSAIRRPVLEWDDGAVTVGLDAEDWERRLG